MPPARVDAKGGERLKTVLELYQGGWRGGTAAYLKTLMPALRVEGYEAVYAAPSGDPGLGAMAGLGVEVVEVASPVALPALARRRKVDLVHSHGVRMNLVGRVAARAARAPQVVTVHSRLEHDYLSRGRMGLASLLAQPGLSGARALIAVSAAVRQDLVERGLRPERIHVVESGLEPPPPAWTRRMLAEAFALPDGAAVLGTVARHHPVKGLDTLIDALALMADDPALPAFVQILMGDGPETPALMARARERGIAERVRFAGFRPDARAIVGALDLFVLPSRAEGFGLAALEAMAAGVAVVATAVGNLPSLLDGGRLGALVPVDDAPALAATVGALLRSPPRRTELAQAGEARYLEAYSAAIMARRTAAVFDALGREDARPPGVGGAPARPS